ncbi:hypothetical protein [Poseidonibacter sp.]|uniref:hypothetical protein n=1 Tax=Poseidonibacter sp. TaxID=2321188 RepID=UPI003C71BC53
MNKQEYILFIFEGLKTEPIIFENIKKYFLQKKEMNVRQDIIFCYGTVIYKLYQEFFIDGSLDKDLDLVTILKPRNKDSEIIKPSQVSEIYLFFDYDSHASNASDIKLQSMLKLFNDETSDYGKLFVSYPMVESLQHVKKEVNFHETIEISQKEYKKIAKENCEKEFLHFNDYTEEIWIYLINQHSKKANFIVNHSFHFPSTVIEQLEIFDNQKIKYIDIENKVAVLSAFPIILLDYYVINFFKQNDNLQMNKDSNE